MQHILRDCPCCDMYMPIDDVYDKLTAMVYDIMVRGARPELQPYLRMNLNGVQRFSTSKKLLRIAAANSEVMLHSRSSKSITSYESTSSGSEAGFIFDHLAWNPRLDNVTIRPGDRADFCQRC